MTYNLYIWKNYNYGGCIKKLHRVGTWFNKKQWQRTNHYGNDSKMENRLHWPLKIQTSNTQKEFFQSVHSLPLSTSSHAIPHKVLVSPIMMVMVTLLYSTLSLLHLAYPWHSNHCPGPLLVMEEVYHPQECWHLDRQRDFLCTIKWWWLTWPSEVTDHRGGIYLKI